MSSYLFYFLYIVLLAVEWNSRLERGGWRWRDLDFGIIPAVWFCVVSEISVGDHCE